MKGPKTIFEAGHKLQTASLLPKNILNIENLNLHKDRKKTFWRPDLALYNRLDFISRNLGFISVQVPANLLVEWLGDVCVIRRIPCDGHWKLFENIIQVYLHCHA